MRRWFTFVAVAALMGVAIIAKKPPGGSAIKLTAPAASSGLY